MIRLLSSSLTVRAAQLGYASVTAACHSACNIDPLSRGIGVQN
jgi:hypothetical protein